MEGKIKQEKMIKKKIQWKRHERMYAKTTEETKNIQSMVLQTERIDKPFHRTCPFHHECGHLVQHFPAKMVFKKG